MKTTILRRKRIVIPAIATVAVLAVGGTLWAASADEVRGDERDRVETAAVTAAGGGKAVDVEKSDDRGEAYEVEVRLEDGREVDITLDDDLRVVERDADDAVADDDAVERPDADDRLLSTAERTAAEKAALAAVGGGTVVDVDPSDDPGVAYEVEVRDRSGAEWDVDLDAAFAVVARVQDR
ncbi:PepSY domain-containing protein [Pimelobacter simplex]|uniref:PepSY domain-containing protein n=1 Tax=Nocardioides simplex TaxID=2045 RepID=UPI00215003D3|nr:PepSY domain-containing protein [Pimelobacter simplex]UUW88221.1 PepSY domain-containing protein [Pimelobacter simplex]UUW97726.1 PepSY domain-containing protein [Pimelobacter simplex]